MLAHAARVLLALLLLSGAALTFAGTVGAADRVWAIAPAVGTGACALSAAVRNGIDIRVEGTGFAAATDVLVTQIWDHANENPNVPPSGPTTTHTYTSTASGTFAFVVPAGPGHGGHYSWTATDQSCTASVEAIAVETAGGTCGTCGGAGNTLPPTDAIDVPLTPTSPSLFLGAVCVAGLIGFVLAVRRRQRDSVDV
jgi:hypothetical protein